MKTLYEGHGCAISVLTFTLHCLKTGSVKKKDVSTFSVSASQQYHHRLRSPEKPKIAQSVVIQRPLSEVVHKIRDSKSASRSFEFHSKGKKMEDTDR